VNRRTFDIASDARHLAALFMDIADEDGVVDEARYDDWMEALGLICGEIGDKLQALRAVKSRLLSEVEVLKAEAKRVSAKAKQRERGAERVRGYMLELLIANRELNPGADKVEIPDGFVRLNRRTSYEVTAPDLGRVHEAYLTRPEPRLNKAAIVVGHKAGITLDGITVTEKVTEHVMEGG
jgi:hypothetical protein